jgi:hypothetical protein
VDFWAQNRNMSVHLILKVRFILQILTYNVNFITSDHPCHYDLVNRHCMGKRMDVKPGAAAS